MNDSPLTPLDPAYRTVLRITGALTAIPLLAVATVAEVAIAGWSLAIWTPAALLAAWLVLRVPLRRFAARGYALGADRLRVVRGVWFHSDTVVPFGRVQHIDVGQGPIERAYAIATLTVHTAGTHNASVSLPGLAHRDALAMRETIRAAIKRDTP